MAEDIHPSLAYKPGERVTIANEDAQAKVGATQGVVVGDTAGQPHGDEPKVVVALDAPRASNAVISPADLAPALPQH